MAYNFGILGNSHCRRNSLVVHPVPLMHGTKINYLAGAVELERKHHVSENVSPPFLRELQKPNGGTKCRSRVSSNAASLATTNTRQSAPRTIPQYMRSSQLSLRPYDPVCARCVTRSKR